MRKILTGACAFTIAASCWLAVMAVVLRHEGYLAQVGLAAGFALQSLLTLAIIAGVPAANWTRPLAALGAAGIIASGARAIALNSSRSQFEGYVLIVGTALVLQGLLTLWYLYSASRPRALGRTAPIW